MQSPNSSTEKEKAYTHTYTAYISVTPSPVHSHCIGGIINRHLVLSTVQIYEKMGMGKLDVYRADLEQRLLEDTRSGHHHPILSWLVQNRNPAPKPEQYV
jgi:hypothetical protein